MRTVTLKEAQECVDLYANLENKMDTAIWIRQNSLGELWIVQVIPSLGHTNKPENPLHFNPHSTNLIVMNKKDIKDVIKRNPILAYDISQGDILYGKNIGSKLKKLAIRQVNKKTK
jgi:hypothetical protein